MSEDIVRAGTPPVALPVISPAAVAPWLLLAALLVALTCYFLGVEQGAFSLFSGDAVHEWTHDGRHLLGFPCH